MSIKQEMRTSGMWPRCLVGGLLAVGVVPHLAWGKTITIAKIDDPAPGAPEGAVFRGFGFPLVNNAGQVAFGGTLRTGLGGVNFSSDVGIWRDDTLVAREGSHAPGTPTDAVFDSLSDFTFNNAGQVGFEADLRTGLGGVDDTNDEGIWLDNTLVAREGSQAPGTRPGIIFGEAILNIRYYTPPDRFYGSICAAGKIVEVTGRCPI